MFRTPLFKKHTLGGKKVLMNGVISRLMTWTRTFLENIDSQIYEHLLSTSPFYFTQCTSSSTLIRTSSSKTTLGDIAFSTIYGNAAEYCLGVRLRKARL